MEALQTFKARYGDACVICNAKVPRRAIAAYALAIASGIPSIGIVCIDRAACHRRVTVR